MVEIDPEKLQRAAPLASWIGPHKVTSTPDVIESISKGEVVRETGYGTDYKVCLPKIRSNPFIHIIQICEGCDGNCSYCCTRFARGSLQSYPQEMIVEEARRAVEEGCVEIEITAQDTAAYGKDTGASLSNLINQVAAIEGDFRIRVGMMHPKSMKPVPNLQLEVIPLPDGKGVSGDCNAHISLRLFRITYEILRALSHKPVRSMGIGTGITHSSGGFNEFCPGFL